MRKKKKKTTLLIARSFLEEPEGFQELQCAFPGLFFVFPSLL